jgi:hypothetical protein
MGASAGNPFADLLGTAYAVIPDPVRALHDRALPARFDGEVDIEAGHGLAARVLGSCAGLPRRSGTFPLRFEIRGDAHRQLWIRHFPPRPMRSRLHAEGGLLCERMGAATFAFRLEGDAGGTRWHVARVRALGVPLPLHWFRGMSAREYAQDGRYRFDVEVSLPMIGHLVAYRGWLDVG